MSKKFYKLEDIADFTGINNFFAAAATPTFSATAQELQLWTEAQFESVFDEHTEKSFYNKETLDPWGAFKIKYTQWLGRNGRFIADELDALLSKYNPIYNYERHEVQSGSDTRTQTPDDWATTKTETPDNWKETTTQTPTNWKQTETQTPTNWKQTETQTPTNWKETETQTPTNWQEENTKSFTNYHETSTQTPTNWSTTETQTPTQWTKTDTDSYTNYHETETQTPDDWVKTTDRSGENANADITDNSVIAFNGSDFARTTRNDTRHTYNQTEEQGGTYETDKTVTGTKQHTETQTGTYQKVTDQAGTYETDNTKTGTETDTKVTSGTFQTETAHSGTFQTETEHTGSFQTETAHTGTYTTETSTTGSRSETIEQTGTMEDLTEYGKQIDITGNVGVTSTVDMINQIISLYDTDFVKRWIERFINSVCVYV